MWRVGITVEVIEVNYLVQNTYVFYPWTIFGRSSRSLFIETLIQVRSVRDMVRTRKTVEVIEVIFQMQNTYVFNQW